VEFVTRPLTDHSARESCDGFSRIAQNRALNRQLLLFCRRSIHFVHFNGNWQHFRGFWM